MGDRYFMLDTNSVSYIIKGKPVTIRERLAQVPMVNSCISAITEAELLRSVAKKPDAKRLAVALKGFLLKVEVLPWDSGAANEVSITNDKAFYNVEYHLALEDWTKSSG